ncbi:hypothetical protein EXS57_00030 [Candidatus Kaiserbacteria bacterium]|nr:hypothetical protein [Candidatus Kaiserbacteria bacterium]
MPPEDSSTSSPQEPTPDAPSPAAEAPTPTDDATTPPQEAPPADPAPGATPSDPEPIPTTQTGPQGPLPSSRTADRQEDQVAQTPLTAQVGRSEPLPPEPKPSAPPSSAARTPAVPAHSVRDLLSRARVAIQDRKRKKRDKIMLALTTKNKITNDEVEKLLHVSDATATRYLSALEKEGKIKQIGKTGHGVVYSKI